MPRRVTTVAVSPERAETLRQIKRERELPNMDAALDEVLQEVSTGA